MSGSNNGLRGTQSNPTTTSGGATHGHGQPQQSQIPLSLKLTDYLRPVFLEAFMIREYCTFTSIQQQQATTSTSTSAATRTSSLENDEVGDDGGSPGTNHRQLLHHPPQPQQPRALTGMYVIPSAQSVYLWFGVLCVNSDDRSSVRSPWHGGVFRFVVRFPENYPSGVPTITVLPIGVSESSCSSASPHHPLNTTPQGGTFSYRMVTSHPDVHPTTGQFNVRAYSSNWMSSTVSPNSRTYKYLRSFRKSFYKPFFSAGTDSGSVSKEDPSAALNVAAGTLAWSDYDEFVRACAADATESTKWFNEIDRLVMAKFKGDANMVLLGEEREGGSAGAGADPEAPAQGNRANGVGSVPGGMGSRGCRSSRTRAMGLSFL